MPKNAGLSSTFDQIDLDSVEREATPELLMKLGVRLHLAELSLSNTVSVLEVFGVQCARSTVHNWFTRQIYSLKMGDLRITLRLTKL